jgi:AhpD family alkylhydroperoxidase
MLTAIRIARAGGAVGRVGVLQEEAMRGSLPAFYNNVTVGGGPASVRAYIAELLPDILEGKIEPGRVFDRIVNLDGGTMELDSLRNRSRMRLHLRRPYMESRFEYSKVAPGVYEAMFGLGKYLQKSGLDESLINLICLRASQINGCAYCIDMHWKDLRAAGEEEQRLYGLDAWEESPYYNNRERAALAWTEALTNLGAGHVSNEVYEEVRKVFTEKELADLTLAVVAINGWNRLNIAARTVPGTYQPGKVHELKKSG